MVKRLIILELSIVAATSAASATLFFEVSVEKADDFYQNDEKEAKDGPRDQN